MHSGEPQQYPSKPFYVANAHRGRYIIRIVDSANNHFLNAEKNEKQLSVLLT